MTRIPREATQPLTIRQLDDLADALDSTTAFGLLPESVVRDLIATARFYATETERLRDAAKREGVPAVREEARAGGVAPMTRVPREATQPEACARCQDSTTRFSYIDHPASLAAGAPIRVDGPCPSCTPPDLQP